MPTRTVRSHKLMLDILTAIHAKTGKNVFNIDVPAKELNTGLTLVNDSTKPFDITIFSDKGQLVRMFPFDSYSGHRSNYLYAKYEHDPKILEFHPSLGFEFPSLI